jgi:glycosyltransferase involved in cell wall biosynthesis
MGHGMGGHFHSLDHISRQIVKSIDARIIAIGPGDSPILKNNPIFAGHFYFTGLNILKLRKELKKFINQYQPDVLHFFDAVVYNIVRILINTKKYKIVVNKCGGPNPKHYPYVKNLVLFSLENLEWFQKQSKYNKTNSHLIPNRVQTLMVDKTFQPITKVADQFVFMRVCRIGAGYKKSIMDAINLIEVLKARNISNVKLYVIGVIEDINLYRSLESHPLVKENLLVVLTDSVYTIDASKMLYLADAVIGTGRGLMEAASVGLPLLVINAVDEMPVLLTRDNFYDAFKTNFSERNIFKNFSNETNRQNIITLIKDKNYYNDNSRLSKEMFDKYFNIKKAEEAYKNVYENADRGGGNIPIMDAPIIARNLLNTYRYYLKAKRVHK